MSEQDTTPAVSDSKEKKTTNPAPYLKADHQRTEPNSSSLVIPAILAIVLAVVIVATFFENEYNSLLATLGLTETDAALEHQASVEPAETTVAVNDNKVATLAPIQSGEDIVHTVTPAAETQGSESTPATEPAADASTGHSDAAQAAALPEPADSDSPDVSVHPTYPYYASPDYGTPYQPYIYPDSNDRREFFAAQNRIWQEIEDRRRKDWEDMMERRRQDWLDAEAARREHLENMLQIRTAVLKRIEKDREDMDKEIQKRNEEFYKRREQAEKRMMEFRRPVNRTKI